MTTTLNERDETFQEEVRRVLSTLGIGATLDERIVKVKGQNYQYASRGDTKMFVDEIERLRAELAA